MPRRPSHSSFRAFSLDPHSAEPLHRQLYDEIRAAILNGRISPGSRLPASRELAQANRISRNTVLSAYDQLLSEGFIQSRPGSGTYVVESLLETMAPAVPENAPGGAQRTPARLSRRGRTIFEHSLAKLARRPRGHVLRPGLPALDHIPSDIWRRLYDRRIRRASVRVLAYDDPQGYAPLREAIASHLGASRGARCGPENVIVVNGAQMAIDLVSRVLLDEGDEVWMEDPGYPVARAAFQAQGCRVVPVPVDHEGMEVASGVARAPHARLAYCTPSHQNPLGVTMSLTRRVALLQWAERAGAWVLEDDNASEYRYRGRPLAALQGIDRSGCVIYVGTFSKVLFSSLRLGYLVAPIEAVPALVAARELVDRQSPGLSQAVLADFMNEGHFARHVRRMRTVYAQRLEAVQRAVAAHAPDLLTVEPVEGGMNCVLWLARGVSDLEIWSELVARGLQCLPLSDYSMEANRPSGLVCGFAGVDHAEIEAAVRRIAETVRDRLGTRTASV